MTMFEQKINTVITMWSVEYTILFTVEMFGLVLDKRYRHNKDKPLDLQHYEDQFIKEITLFRKRAYNNTI